MPKPRPGSPNPAQAGLEAAVAAHQEHRLETAERLYRAYILTAPQDAAAHNLLGSLLFQSGRPKAGLASIERARALKPDMPPYLVNAALCHLSLGDTSAAVDLIDRALLLSPKSWDVKAARLVSAEQAGDADMAALLRLAFHNGGVDAAKALAMTHLAVGQRSDALAAAAFATAQAPRDPAALDLYRGLAEEPSSDRPLSLVRDQARRTAYRRAIEATVQPDDDVVMLGAAGGGLLALMAAQAGAKSVTVLEPDPTLAAVARRVIGDNDQADRVRVSTVASTDAKMGHEVKAKASVLLADLSDAVLAGDGGLHRLNDARLRLCRRDARVIPRRARLHAALVEAADMSQSGPLTEPVEGVDLSALNRLVTGQRRLPPLSGQAWRDLSAPMVLFDFDFTQLVPLWGSTDRDVAVTAAGQPDALRCWVTFDLDDTAAVQRDAGAGPGDPGDLFVRLSPRDAVAIGDTATLTIAYARSIIQARWHP